MPKKILIPVLIAGFMILFFTLAFGLGFSNYKKVSMKLVDYNPDENSTYKVVVKTENNKDVVYVKTKNSNQKVGELMPFPNNVPVDFLMFETKTGRYIVSKINTKTSEFNSKYSKGDRLDTIFYARPELLENDDSMRVMRVSYINKDGVAITPIASSEYYLWQRIETVGISADKLDGFIYDADLNPNPRIDIYNIPTEL